MVEPVATTGLVIASGLFGGACNLLGATADLHGLGATHLIKRLTQRFDSAPDDTPVFFRATWRAAVQATHGCVQQVFDHTDVSDDVRGDLRTWNRYRDAHLRVRKVRGWGDAAELPHILERELTQSLPQALQVRADANSRADSMELIWTCYCEALRAAGFDGEPPAVIRQAFFGERPEAKVWSWSKHFALRVGEQLRGNAGFKAMFDALQFAGIGEGIARLIADFEPMADTLTALSDKFDRVQESVERTEQNTVELKRGQQEILDALRQLQASFPPTAVGLNEEIERLRQRPDIRIEDLIGWLQSAFNRNDPLPPEALPKLLKHALTVDLPNLRRQADAYRLDPLASVEAQALLEEVRALLQPQAGKPLDLQEAKDKLKALDDRFVAERAERRRREDRELAGLRVWRAETERATANYSAAAELMEQASELCGEIAQIQATLIKKAAEYWYEHGQLHPGAFALERSIALIDQLLGEEISEKERVNLQILRGIVFSVLAGRQDSAVGLQLLINAEDSFLAALELCSREAVPVDWAMIQNNLGNHKQVIGQRLFGEVSLQVLQSSKTHYSAALEVYTREAMPLDWAMTKNNLGVVQRILGERIEGEAGLQALRSAEACYREALEVRTREAMPTYWADTQKNLGAVLRVIGERLSGEAGLQALQSAEASCRGALEVNTRMTMPVDWAMAQIIIGNVQTVIGRRLHGEAGLQMLRSAVAHYRHASEISTR